MNFLRGGTWSPMSMSKTSSAAGGVFEVHPQQRARGGVHGRVPQLLGVHFTQTLVALDLELARVLVLVLDLGHGGVALGFGVGVVVSLP